jgi:hypothetical protein
MRKERINRRCDEKRWMWRIWGGMMVLREEDQVENGARSGR